MSALVQWAKQFFQYLGGEQDDPPDGLPLRHDSLLWGVWWAVLLGIMILFCGQSSKFIYIDF